MSDYNPFYDDVKERNAMKSGASHKVNGSKSKRCTLPSDNLTPAQKRKLNGPVKEYELHKAMPWAEFKQLPLDLQQVHLDYIQRRFRVGPAIISKLVFGLSDSGLWFYAKEKGLTYVTYRGQRLTEATREAIENWMNGIGEPEPVTEEPTEAVVVDAPVEETPVAEPAPVPENPVKKLVVENLSAHISGTADDLLSYISAMLAGRSADVRIELNFKEE